MKKITFWVFILFATLQLQAQLTNGNFTTEVDERLKNLNKTPITSNILIDRVFQAAGIPAFNQGTRKDTSSYVHFKQAWSELNRASYAKNFATIEQFKQQIKNNNYAKNIVPIGIINTEFHQNNFGETSSEATVSFNPTTGLFSDISEKNPFLKKQTTIIAPLVKKAVGNTIVFKVDPLFKLHKQGKTIKTLQLFTNNTNFTLIATHNLKTNSFSTAYANSGVKVLKFTIVFSDNSTKVTYGRLKVEIPTSYSQTSYGHGGNPFELKTIDADSDLWYQGYDETQAYKGRNEYRIYYDKINDDEIVNKPLYILDGFDPEDKRKIDPQSPDYNEENKSIVELMKYDHDNNPDNPKINLIDSLTHKGFDVIVVNHPIYKSGGKSIDGGTDYIQRNAYTFISLLRYIKEIQQGTEKAVVIGPSMGGLISRYALAYMEKKHNETGLEKWNHNTRLWVSFDSPHQGANIPMGVQKGIQYFAKELEVESAQEFIDLQLDQPATRQMLVNHYTNTTSKPKGAPNFRNRFQAELDNLGMPQNLRKTALINGSVMGALNGVSKAKYLEIDDELTHASLLLLGPILNVFYDKFLAKMYHSTNQKIGSEKSFILDAGIRGSFLWWSWWTTRTSGDEYKSQPTLKGSYDIAPGGYTNAQQQLALASDTPNTDFTWYLLNWTFHDLNTKVYDPTHSFIPTKSALAYTGSNMLDEVIGNRDRACTGETPFDSYYAPQNNEQHIFLTSENVAWLTKEIEGEEQPVKTYAPLSSPTIIGYDYVCYDQLTDFHTSLGSSCVNEVVWLVSSNLEIITNNGAKIAIRAKYNTTTKTGWIKTIVKGVTAITKHVEIGKPEASRITFNRFRNYNFQSQTWNLLGAYYDWNLMIDKYTWEWLVPNSMTRHTSPQHSYINFRPIHSSAQIYIRTRASNNCGCSDWKGQWFNVIYNNSTPCGGVNQPPCKSDIIEY